MIRLENVYKEFSAGGRKQVVLENINCHIGKGEMVAIMGTSGAGKSTLLHILGLLDTVTDGNYILANQAVGVMKEREKAKVRNKEIGFVFQGFHLVKELSAIENVQLTLQMGNIHRKKKISGRERLKKSKEVLEKVGLEDCINKKPSQLSGGQKQRVAIARALVGQPSVILADEPTGALDSNTSQEIMNLLCSLHKEGHTIIVVTHDREVANQCERIIEIADGKILS